MNHSWQFSARTAQDDTSPGLVCSHNEWDPLEEVIVGRLEGAVCLSWSLGLQPFADYRPRADRYGGLPRSLWGAETSPGWLTRPFTRDHRRAQGDDVRV
jgi:hypothetical protein